MIFFFTNKNPSIHKIEEGTIAKDKLKRQSYLLEEVSGQERVLAEVAVELQARTSFKVEKQYFKLKLMLCG